MKRYCWMLIVIVVFFLAACSKSADQEKKGAIQEMTDETAGRAVEKIRTPIEQAEAVKKQEEERAGKIEEELNEE
ncbi:MAG: hypothetical protein OEV42_19525 [Deltaproteobacteria bacterium]|nr:hypothetical protein [Deltaproteobacteria bacterium]